VGALKGLGLFKGWNVTIPHKEAIARLADRLSPEARLIGAANVVEFRDGKVLGHNTDAYGVSETLREQGLDLRRRGVLLIGAGGAALSVGYAAGRARAATVWIANRSPERARRAARRLARRFPRTRFRAIGLDALEDFTEEIGLYVNATPLGMKGFAARSLLPSIVCEGALAFDLVYRPARTPFLEQAEERGLRTVGGLDMLIWQAIRTWEIWFGPVRGKRAVKAALRKHLERTLQ
jgi:shikimate dehydrogenase